MIRFLVVLCLLVPALRGAERITICGGEEIYQIDPSVEPVKKLWSWRAKDRPEIPEALKGSFGTTDECKPVDGGKRLLVCSSGGGCALLEMPSGKAVWWARVTNAHSIEMLPGGGIAVASSVGKGGDQVVFFDGETPREPLARVALPSAHGLVWDDGRTGLWALGYRELVFLQAAKGAPRMSFEVVARYPLPDEDGHDLRAVPSSHDLILSTHAHVWRFNRESREFRAEHRLKDRARVKGIDIHPRTARVVITQASEEAWWTDTLGFLDPEATLRLPGERIYKARWFPEEP